MEYKGFLKRVLTVKRPMPTVLTINLVEDLNLRNFGGLEEPILEVWLLVYGLISKFRTVIQMTGESNTRRVTAFQFSIAS